MIKRIGRLASEEVNIFKTIIGRFKRRDFSGNTGQAVKNSTYSLSTNVAAKVGSLLFTAILARIFLPEIFGLYSLALATIIFFSAFSDLGLDNAMITFIAKNLDKKNHGTSKAYFFMLGRLKLIVTAIASVALIVLSYVLANSYYNKPIFFALLAGGIYLPFASLSRFAETAYTANNNFRSPLLKEMFFQIIRVILIPAIIIPLSRAGFSGQYLVTMSIIVLSICYFLSSLYLILPMRKRLAFLRSKKKKLTKADKIKVKDFTIPMALVSLSGVFFGFVDTLMLGRFVSGEFIGYYGAASSLISSVMVMLSFTAAATYPIIAKIKGKSFDAVFWKIIKFSFLLSLIAAVMTFLGANYFIIIIYGKAFQPAVLFLRLLSILAIVGTLIANYSNYIILKERTGVFSLIVTLTTLVNLSLNYFFIKRGLLISMEMAVIGVCIAGIISKVFYLICLVIAKRIISKN